MGEDTAITALAALVGAAIGAWLTSELATRRERWNLRRELYAQLLESLNEAKEAMQLLLAVEVSDLAHVGNSSDAEGATRLRDKRQKLGLSVSQAIQRLRRTASVAQILLSKDNLQSLDQLKREQQDSLPSISYFPLFDQQLRALCRAQKLVVEAARQELGMLHILERSPSIRRAIRLWKKLQVEADSTDWKPIVMDRWGSSVQWVRGTGPFALVAPCRALTVTLWKDEQEAERERLRINQVGCGGQCNWALHVVIDLRQE